MDVTFVMTENTHVVRYSQVLNYCLSCSSVSDNSEDCIINAIYFLDEETARSWGGDSTMYCLYFIPGSTIYIRLIKLRHKTYFCLLILDLHLMVRTRVGKGFLSVSWVSEISKSPDYLKV